MNHTLNAPRKKKPPIHSFFLLFLGVFLVLVTMQAATAVTDNLNINWTGTQSRSSALREGMTFFPNQNVIITQFCRDSTSAASLGFIYKNGTGLIFNATLDAQGCANGNTAITTGTAYGLYFGHTTGWNSTYWSRGGSTTLVIHGAIGNFTDGFINNSGTIDMSNDYFYNLKNVTFTVITSPNTTYTFNAYDLYDDSALDGVNFTTTNGSCVTSGGTCTLSFSTTLGTIAWNASKSGYYSDTGTVAANASAQGNLSQANYTFIFKDLFGDSILGGYNVTAGKSYTKTDIGASPVVYLRNGNNTLLFSKTGYYDLSFVVNVATVPSTNTSYTVTGVYDAIYSVTAKNTFTNASISNFTINLTTTGEAYAPSTTTTNGTALFPVMKGEEYYLFIDAAGYAYANTTQNVTNATPFYEFGLYSNNSVYIYIYDQDTGNPIYSNTTIIVTGSASETTYYTTAGSYFVENLADGNYTVKLTAANYSLSTYSVTVVDRSTQRLNAYLTSSTSNVILTAKDAQSGVTIEGVNVGMYRLINSTLTLVESKNTDITGRAQFTYSTGVKYSFTMAKTDYTTKTFSLDPVLFSSYDVYMEKTVSETMSYGDVSVYYTPTLFYNNATNNLTFTITSANGILSGYNVSLAWPGGTHNYYGTNANGAAFNYSFNITGAGVLDTVNLTYTYQTVFSENVTRRYDYLILGGTSAYSIDQNRDNTYGLGVFERVLIAMTITIISAGLAAIAAGLLPALIVALFVMGFMMYIGFIPLLAFLISILAGLLLLTRKAGD